MPLRKASSPNQFLQKVGHTWYARVRVPRSLEARMKQTHLRESLQTGDLAEANRKKFAVVASLKAKLAAEAKAQAEGIPPGKFVSALDTPQNIREELARLRAAGDDETAEALEDMAVTKAEQIEERHDYARAKKWLRAAVDTDDTLRELHSKWLEASDFRGSTQHGYKLALTELLAFIGDEDARPREITRAAAIRYIEGALTQRGLAYNTIRDRLAALTSFWGYLESRGAAPRGSNPWTGHKVSKKKHAGRGEAKRAYTEEELLLLLKGTPKANRMASAGYLRDLTVLQMFSGTRIEEVCSRKVEEIEWKRGYAVLRVEDAKTKAGNRPVVFTHAAPLAVLKRRTKGKKPGEQLFEEAKPGGLDKKYSKDASNYFTRYRRACGVADGTDNHSYRRTVMTLLEHAGIRQVLIARFTGHKVGTLAADTYSEGGSVAQAKEVSKEIRYKAAVEREALRAA